MYCGLEHNGLHATEVPREALKEVAAELEESKKKNGRFNQVRVFRYQYV